MDPDPASDPPPRTTYTLSLTARACLQAVRIAAWIEAMVAAHRAAQPDGAGAWLWFLCRCLLLTIGAQIVVSIAAEFAKRRSLRSLVRFPDGAARARDGGDGPAAAPPVSEPLAFDRVAFEAAAAALLFHFGGALWMWIFT